MPRVTGTVLMLAAGAAWSSLGASALGQNALGDGRALDKSLSTQGRTNTQVKNIEQQIRFNNAIVEGRAGAGRSFRGDLGYRSTDDFAGSLGSDTLYTFQRDAASGGLASIPGVRSSDALRYQFALTGGGGGRSAGLAESARALFTERSAGQVASGSTSVTSTGPLSSSAVSSLRSVSQYHANAALSGTVLGYAGTEQTGRFALTASPLRGIAPTPLGQIPGAGQEPGGRFAPPGLSGLERSALGVSPAGDMQEPGRPRNPAPDLRIDGAGTAFDEVRQSLIKVIDPRLNVAPASSSPATPGAEPSATDPKDPSKPEAPGQAPRAEGTDPLRDMDRLSARLRGAKTDKPDAGKPAPGASLLPGLGSKPPSLLEAPAKPAPEPPASPDESAVQALKRMEAKISTFKVKPEKAGEAYARRMAEGETQMQSGAYFDAEGSFSLALLARPKDPMASIARAHAQLGAGLLLSAASNLREVLAAAPELIGTRYELKILPTFQRAESAVRTIRTELAKKDSALGSDGALLMAYMGRHFEQAEWLAEGLESLDRRTAADDARGRELVSVLKRVWTAAPERTAPPEAAPEGKPAPAMEK